MSAITAAGLTGAQKCAILVLLLEEAQAAELLRRMPAAEVRAVGEAMLSVAEIEPAAIDAVLDEFIARSRGISTLDSQGRQVRAVLSRALGPPRAARVIDHLGPPASPRRFAGLDWLDTPAIAALLADEHPQAITVVLAHLPEATAAGVLDALPAPLQSDLVLRLATLKPVAPAVIASLEADLEAKLAAEIAAQQFVFADLKALSTKDMQLVLREADPQGLAVAMKGADDELRDQIFAAMSSRAASQLQDELAERGPMKRAEVEAAQLAICALVRRLGESGAVMMPGSAGAYV